MDYDDAAYNQNTIRADGSGNANIEVRASGLLIWSKFVPIVSPAQPGGLRVRLSDPLCGFDLYDETGNALVNHPFHPVRVNDKDITGAALLSYSPHLLDGQPIQWIITGATAGSLVGYGFVGILA